MGGYRSLGLGKATWHQSNHGDVGESVRTRRLQLRREARAGGASADVKESVH